MITNPKPKLNQLKPRKCLICLREIIGRGKNALTCSRKCSQAYQRTYIYIGSMMRKNLLSKLKFYMDSLK